MISIPDGEWVAHLAKNNVTADYQRFGAQPGMYYDPNIAEVYGKASVIKEMKYERSLCKVRWASMLGGHEEGHKLHPKEFDHKTGVLHMLARSIACGFDLRAPTRLLRFRVGKWQDCIDEAWEEVGAL